VALDILDAFYRRGQKAFEQIGDASFHLLRQQAGVEPDDAGDGNRDIREDVRRHVEYRHAPQQYDEDGHDDEGVRPAQGDEDDLVHPRNLTPRRDSPVPTLRDQSHTAALSTLSLRELPQPCSSPAFNLIKNSLS
jgi:hypothetical protein